MMQKVSIFYDADYATMEGGGQKRLFEISKKINEEINSEINWISFKFWDDGKSFSKDGINYYGFINRPSFYNKHGSRSSFEPILYLLNCLICIPKYIKSNTFIIGQWPLLHVLPLIVLGLVFKKNIYIEWWETLQSQWLKRGFLGKIGAFIERLIIRTSTYVTFIVECNSEKELILKINKKAKVTIIENGVDLDSYKFNENNKIYDFICLGRLVPQKNIDMVINAVGIIKDKGNDINLCIVGDGPCRKQLELLIIRNNLESNITMTGFLENDKDKINYIQKSKIGIIVQDGVGRGNVVINELMAAGLPIIAAGTPNGIDPSYIIEGKNGYFLNTLDYNELAKLMNSMLVNKEDTESMSLYLKKNAYNLSWAKKLENYPVLGKKNNEKK